MSSEKMTEQESLRLITSMIQKAKGGINDNGTGALLWGTVVTLAGLLGFIKYKYAPEISWLDPWLLCVFALIPQVYLTIKEKKEKKLVKQYDSELLDAVWTIYGLSIFMLVAYFNIVGFAAKENYAAIGKTVVLKDLSTGEAVENYFNTYSSLSLLLLLFCIPTLITGIGKKNKPMLYGGMLCVAFFVASLFTNTMWDNLLAGLAGLFNWFIPGMYMRKEFLKAGKKNQHV
jgi:Na+/melibiose symporter-like transporter